MRVLPDPEPRHPKLVLQDAIQDALQSPDVNPEIPPPFTLTRWVLIGELMLPGQAKGLVTVTSNFDGSGLHTWEEQGPMLSALVRSIARSMRAG